MKKPQLDKEHSTPYRIRLPNSDLRELRRLRMHTRYSISDLVRMAVAEYVDRQRGGAE